MELLYIIGIWLFLLYLIRIHKELFYYRKVYNQHKDIYVPSYAELIRNKILAEEFFHFIAEYFNKAYAKISFRSLLFGRKDNLSVLTLPTASDEKI